MTASVTLQANASDAIMRRLHADRGENHDPTGSTALRQAMSTEALTRHKRTMPEGRYSRSLAPHGEGLAPELAMGVSVVSGHGATSPAFLL
jgi:hypothetical protein